jgi:hypothetical protein
MTMNEFDRDMAATTFAEAGEHATARKIMNDDGTKKSPVREPKKNYTLPMVIFGAMSIGLYVALFRYQGWVTDTFTKGGIYTAWPILTAFVFSFIHGAFASNLLSFLGIEAKKH